MARENARQKADRPLLEGRLVITNVTPGNATAITRSEGHLWHQTYRRGCPARSDQRSHLNALRRVVAVDVEEPR